MVFFELKKKLMKNKKERLRNKLRNETVLAKEREEIASLNESIQRHKSRGVDKKENKIVDQRMKKTASFIGDVFRNAGKVSLIEPQKQEKNISGNYKKNFVNPKTIVRNDGTIIIKPGMMVKVKPRLKKKNMRSPFDSGLFNM